MTDTELETFTRAIVAGAYLYHQSGANAHLLDIINTISEGACAARGAYDFAPAFKGAPHAVECSTLFDRLSLAMGRYIIYDYDDAETKQNDKAALERLVELTRRR